MADDLAIEGWTIEFHSRLLHSFWVASVDAMNCLTVTIEMPWYLASSPARFRGLADHGKRWFTVFDRYRADKEP
jgi:hypothetical protein